MQETQERRVWSLGQEDPLEEEMTTYSSILASKPLGQRSLAGYSPWGHKEQDRTECLSKHTRMHHQSQGKNFCSTMLTNLSE